MGSAATTRCWKLFMNTPQRYGSGGWEDGARRARRTGSNGWCGGRRSARCRNRGSSMSFECGQQRVMRLGWERPRSLALRRVLTNRMREYFTYGSVGGAGGNPGSYPAANPAIAFEFGHEVSVLLRPGAPGR